jgi:hypothetical protein
MAGGGGAAIVPAEPAHPHIGAQPDHDFAARSLPQTSTSQSTAVELKRCCADVLKGRLRARLPRDSDRSDRGPAFRALTVPTLRKQRYRVESTNILPAAHEHVPDSCAPTADGEHHDLRRRPPALSRLRTSCSPVRPIARRCRLRGRYRASRWSARALQPRGAAPVRSLAPIPPSTAILDRRCSNS